MKWTALNGFGALLWLIGLSFAIGVAHPGGWSAFLPANALPLGGILGVIGLATLLWANLGDA